MIKEHRVVIALGSNLGVREEYIAGAIEEIAHSVEIASISTLIETEPVGGPEQGRYLNGVLIGKTRLDPHQLISTLLSIESRLGRIRTEANAPRTIDLDLIDYDGCTIESAGLTLPHPRAHQRHFVLAPWFEIEPEGMLVGHGSLRDLLQRM